MFEEVYADNRSGSGLILQKIQDLLIACNEKSTVIQVEKLMNELNRLRDHFSFFGLVNHFINKLETGFSGFTAVSALELGEWVERYRQQWADAQTRASNQLADTVRLNGRSILLHSNSSAIHNLFGILKGRNTDCTIWQTYSSPAGEGTDQAETLAGLGYSVMVFHEDAISKIVPRIDLAIFGTDLIQKDHFVNKIGTYPLSLMCNQFQKPVFVLGEKRKIVESSAEPGKLAESKAPPTELYPSSTGNIEVFNSYFEATPLNLVEAVFTG